MRELHVGLFLTKSNAINHDILFSKCEFSGFRDKTNALLRSYLSDNYQKVLINNNSSDTTTFSEWCKIKYNENGNVITSACSKVEHGVARGSVLGRLLSLIFINDLPKFVNDKSVPILFADDTSFLVSHPKPMVFYNIFNTVFQTLSDWFQHNFLFSNFTKTHFIKFITQKIIKLK